MPVPVVQSGVSFFYASFCIPSNPSNQPPNLVQAQPSSLSQHRQFLLHPQQNHEGHNLLRPNRQISPGRIRQICVNTFAIRAPVPLDTGGGLAISPPHGRPTVWATDPLGMQYLFDNFLAMPSVQIGGQGGGIIARTKPPSIGDSCPSHFRLSACSVKTTMAAAAR